MLLLSIFFFLIGIWFSWVVYDTSTSEIVVIHLILALAFIHVAGHFHGMARGHWEIELRRRWKKTGQWNPGNFLGPLVFFGLGMTHNEADEEGWFRRN